MRGLPVYIGIDVACGAGKRLPICVVSPGDRLEPLEIPNGSRIPRGLGNKEVAEPEPFRKAALDVATAIASIARAAQWRVERIAVDAPASPPAKSPRLSERDLANSRLSAFQTPSAKAWVEIRQKCRAHLGSGRSLATLPHANKIWMLFGFHLFRSLREALSAEVIETYPFAIVSTLLTTVAHKSTEDGYADQLAAVAKRTGWTPRELEARLKATVAGSRHDRLDAFMAAWTASLPLERRRAFGDAEQPNDAIWTPLSAPTGA